MRLWYALSYALQFSLSNLTWNFFLFYSNEKKSMNIIVIVIALA